MHKILKLTIICFVTLTIHMIHGNKAHAKIHAKTLKIAFDSSYYPMTFYNTEHKLTGIDVDIANLVAKRLHFRIKWIERNRNTLLRGLLANQYRIIWSGFAITPNRRKQVLFSNPYYADSNRIILKFETGKKIKTVCGLRVGIQLGTTARNAGSHISCPMDKKITFTHYENNIQAFQDLNKNKIRAIILNTNYGLYYSSKHLKEYRMFPDPLTKSENKGIAFRLEDSQLKNTIDQSITYLKHKGEIQKIFLKWAIIQ